MDIVHEINTVRHQNVINATNDFIFREIVCDTNLKLDLTNEEEVNKIISDLKKNSAPGHDQISVCDLIVY